MNRKSLTAKLIVLVMLLLLFCAIAVQIIFGGWSTLFSLGSKSGIRGSLAYSGNFDGVTSLNVGAASFSVEVITHDRDVVTVDFYRIGFCTAAEPVVDMKNGVLSVKESKQMFGIHLGSGKIVISVPADSVLAYGLHSTSGSVKLDARSSTAELNSVSGSVKVYQPGDILKASSTSGSVKAYAPFKEIDAHSISGSVKVVADAQTVSILASSTSGAVNVALENVSGYTLDYKSTSGTTKDGYHDFSYGGGRGNAAWGDESLEIKASSISGSIKLTDWND